MNVSRRKSRLRSPVAVSSALLFLSQETRAFAGQDPSWTKPIEPFRVVGNVYYVGTEGIASYLITSPEGDVLLDGGLSEDAPMIERSVSRLGFSLRDVKVLINSHAHSDHAGGLVQLKRDTGAPLWASAGDRWALENGRNRGDDDYGDGAFPRVRVDHVLHDGEALRLGGIAGAVIDRIAPFVGIRRQADSAEPMNQSSYSSAHDMPE